MSALDAYHVRKFIVTEIWNVPRLLLPGIPDYGVGEVIFLHSHFPAGNDIRNDMLWLRVLVDPVCPFAYCDNVATFLKDLVVSSLQMRTKRSNRNRLVRWSLGFVIITQKFKIR